MVVSILLYGCETWTLLVDDERRIQALETRCLRKLLRISHREDKTSDCVQSLVKSLVGPREPLLATVRRRKLAWFGHVMRQPSRKAPSREDADAGGNERAGPTTSRTGRR